MKKTIHNTIFNLFAGSREWAERARYAFYRLSYPRYYSSTPQARYEYYGTRRYQLAYAGALRANT